MGEMAHLVPSAVTPLRPLRHLLAMLLLPTYNAGTLSHSVLPVFVTIEYRLCRLH